MAIEQAKITFDMDDETKECGKGCCKKHPFSFGKKLPIYRKVSWIVSILKNDDIIVCIV